MASSREQALRHSQILKRHLLNIGFLLSTKKCCWEPLQMQQLLGFIIDTKKMELRLPKEEINRIKKDMRAILKANLLSIRKLAAIASLLQSTAMAISELAITHGRSSNKCIVVFTTSTISATVGNGRCQSPQSQEKPPLGG
jgi:hypothetical protein